MLCLLERSQQSWRPKTSESRPKTAESRPTTQDSRPKTQESRPESSGLAEIREEGEGPVALRKSPAGPITRLGSPGGDGSKGVDGSKGGDGRPQHVSGSAFGREGAEQEASSAAPGGNAADVPRDGGAGAAHAPGADARSNDWAAEALAGGVAGAWVAAVAQEHDAGAGAAEGQGGGDEWPEAGGTPGEGGRGVQLWSAEEDEGFGRLGRPPPPYCCPYPCPYCTLPHSLPSRCSAT